MLPPGRDQNDDPEISVVMPCLNEAKTVGRCVEKARQCLERLRVAGEVIVADNGSTDGSQEIAATAGARVVSVHERGYGAALYHGILESRGRYVILGDSDDSYDFGRLDPFIDRLRHGAPVVMGDRFAGGISPGAMPWKNRYIGNPALSLLGRLLFGSPVRDFHCGLRAMSRAAFDQMDLQTTGMEFASEFVIKATLLRLRIDEVPTTLEPDGRGRPPHLRPWRDGWRHLRFMLLYSPRWLFFYPGCILFTAGFAATLYLLPAPRQIANNVVVDVHTLLYAGAAMLLGFQAICFSFFGRIFAYTTGLMPKDVALERMFKIFNLELGLAVGAVLFLGGLGGSVWAVVRWSAADFGPLDAQSMLRTAIPSVGSMCLGGQVILMSLLFSLLGLKRR